MRVVFAVLTARCASYSTAAKGFERVAQKLSAGASIWRALSRAPVWNIMEIYLDKRAVRQIRMSAADAVEEDDFDTLREDIAEAFTDDQIEEIERRIDSGDFEEFLSDILDEWSGEDIEELFELLEAQLSEAGVDLKYQALEMDDEEEDDDDDFDDDGELPLGDDDDDI